jgi:hypothetical protein
MTLCKHGLEESQCGVCTVRPRRTQHSHGQALWGPNRKCANCGGRMYSQLQQHRTLCRKCEKRREGS